MILYLYFLSLKIVFVQAVSVDPDEMPHYAALQLGLHSFSKYTFWSYQFTKVKYANRHKYLQEYKMLFAQSLCLQTFATNRNVVGENPFTKLCLKKVSIYVKFSFYQCALNYVNDVNTQGHF